MKGLADNTRVAVDGLLANKLRSGLTMLGVVIGVAAVVALLSIGQGASASITERIESAGTNLLFVSPGSMNRGPVRGPMGSATTLTFNDADALADPANVPDASSVAPEFSSRAQIIVGNNNTNVSVTGVTPEYAEVLGLSMAEGEFVSDSNVNRRSTVAVLGSGVAEELFGGVDPLGSKIKIASTDASGRRLLVTVVGVLEEKGESMLSDPDSSVFVPITTAQNRLFDGRNARGEPIVSRINVAARSDDLTDAVSEQIDATLRGTHGLASTDDADFNVMSLSDLLEVATEVTTIMQAFLGLIAGISLIVGGIGIMNIMLVSVTERTREIGLRKAVGARQSDVLSQFLIEAVMLSALGGLLGVVSGLAVAKAVDMSGLMAARPSVFAVVLAFVAAVVVGLVFGVMPASRASELSPIEALRYE